MKTAALIAIGLTSFLALSLQAQTTITDWTFDNLPTGFILHPTASTGTGFATALGMDNNYPTPGTSTNVSDIYSSAGSSDPSGPLTWRIRGGKNTSTAANGWSSAAPIGTQGAEFDVSTVGFDNIQISFDINTTTAAEANMELEYTTDGVNWNNAVISYSGASATVKNNSTSANTVTGTYIQFSASAWINGITADFSSIGGVNNNASFGLRMVNASTGVDCLNGSGTAYNNSSGNWRFDNVLISGTPTPTPEPSTLTLIGFGLAGIWQLARRKTS